MFKKIRWSIAQITELWWWRYYLKPKKVNDYLVWKKNYWETVLAKLHLTQIDFAENSILDTGCGPAGIFMVFKNAAVTAVDPLILSYENKLAHFKRSFYSNVVFEQNTIESYHSTKHFDYIFCMNAINHVQDLPQSILNLSSMLKGTGKLIISIDAHNHTWLKKLFQFIPGDILHPHQYDIKEYTNLLTVAGFKLDDTQLYKKGNIFNYYIIVASKSD